MHRELGELVLPATDTIPPIPAYARSRLNEEITERQYLIVDAVVGRSHYLDIRLAGRRDAGEHSRCNWNPAGGAARLRSSRGRDRSHQRGSLQRRDPSAS
jgi:hypothetical protein